MLTLPQRLQHCARVLLEFNGGTSCVQVYVNQHDFFITRDRIGGSSQSSRSSEVDFWKALSNPHVPSPKTEPTLAALYDEIRLTVKDEAQIIQAVFPQPQVVMRVFLQRVFAQVIQQHLEALFEKASSTSTLASLRLLHISHQLTTQLAEDLKQYEFTSVSNPAGSTALVAAAAASAAGAGGGGGLTVGQTLEGCLEEMFAPYLEGKRYLDRERKGLGELYGGFLLRFTKYHVRLFLLSLCVLKC